jgi:cysteinyl-tRNA synthetase
MYQLDHLQNPDAVRGLASSGYDLLVIEPTFNIKGNENFNLKAMVKSLHDGKPGRLVLAYLDIGEAENTRTYWGTMWRTPGGANPGRPGFLLAPDPDGDTGSFLVLYWRMPWKNIFLRKGGIIERLMAAGFDGVYLDWIEACDDQQIVDAAVKDKVDAEKAMVDFIAEIRQKVRQLKPDGVVIGQNAAFLIDDDPRYAAAVDGVAFEDTWFSGKSDARWSSPDAGDIPNTDPGDDSPAGLVRQYQKYSQAGLPVFTIDYCVNPQNAQKVYLDSAAVGFVPLVTRASADEMTLTPPPGLDAGATTKP